MKPLQECVEKLKEVAKRYHERGRFARLAQFRRDGDDIQRLHARIESVVHIMGLSGAVTNGGKLDQILVRSIPVCKFLLDFLPRAGSAVRMNEFGEGGITRHQTHPKR